MWSSTYGRLVAVQEMHCRPSRQDRTLTVQNEAPISSQTTGLTTRGERGNPVDRSMRRQGASPSTSQTEADVRPDLRLSVPAVALAISARGPVAEHPCTSPWRERSSRVAQAGFPKLRRRRRPSRCWCLPNNAPAHAPLRDLKHADLSESSSRRPKREPDARPWRCLRRRCRQSL
jgi:hypothetical protein